MGSILSSPQLTNSALLDFQVQAQTGYYLRRYVEGQMPDTPLHTNGYWEITFNKSEVSDWSSTQTVTNPLSSNLPSSSSPTQIPVITSSSIVDPTNKSTNVPTQDANAIQAGSGAPIPELPAPLALMFFVALTITLLLALRRSKPKSKQSFL
jgi:hypothetical protein